MPDPEELRAWPVVERVDLADPETGRDVTVTIYSTPDGPLVALSSSGSKLEGRCPGEYYLTVEP